MCFEKKRQFQQIFNLMVLLLKYFDINSFSYLNGKSVSLLLRIEIYMKKKANIT